MLKIQLEIADKYIKIKSSADLDKKWLPLVNLNHLAVSANYLNTLLPINELLSITLIEIILILL